MIHCCKRPIMHKPFAELKRYTVFPLRVLWSQYSQQLKQHLPSLLTTPRENSTAGRNMSLTKICYLLRICDRFRVFLDLWCQIYKRRLYLDHFSTLTRNQNFWSFPRHYLRFLKWHTYVERFHVTSSKSNFYTIHPRKLLLSYLLEFHNFKSETNKH